MPMKKESFEECAWNKEEEEGKSTYMADVDVGPIPLAHAKHADFMQLKHNVPTQYHTFYDALDK